MSGDTTDCPLCGFLATTFHEEVEHMQEKHPEVVAARLEASGFKRELDGTWTDTLASED